MRLEPTPRPTQAVRVSARLIASSTILHLSSDELERAVNQEQVDNPTLAVQEQQICFFCGTRAHGQLCSVCGHFLQPTQPLISGHERLTQHEHSLERSTSSQQAFYDIDNYGFAEDDSIDEYDPLALIPTGETLLESLLQQLEALVSPEDAPIAEQLVGNLNERGYLEITPLEIAHYLDVPVERVDYVLSQLHTLEPLGIGARDLRECLLLQLQAVSEHTPPPPLVQTLIDGYLDLLGHNQFHEIARLLKVSEQAIRQASQYIRSTLYPFPAHVYSAESSSLLQGSGASGASYIRPDVIIRRGEMGFEVELIEEKRYRFHVRTPYAGEAAPQAGEMANSEVQRYIHQHTDRAKFFVSSVRRRWSTLRRVAELIVDEQRDFLDKGVRYLHPLTRAEVAARLGLDEGTVSRATANKYALLPKGHLIPFSDFFDSSLGMKDLLRELIQHEDAQHRLSDDELARLLTKHGYAIARRTVTKYREELGIGSSRER